MHLSLMFLYILNTTLHVFVCVDRTSSGWTIYTDKYRLLRNANHLMWQPSLDTKPHTYMDVCNALSMKPWLKRDNCTPLMVDAGPYILDTDGREGKSCISILVGWHLYIYVGRMFTKDEFDNCVCSYLCLILPPTNIY